MKESKKNAAANLLFFCEKNNIAYEFNENDFSCYFENAALDLKDGVLIISSIMYSDGKVNDLQTFAKLCQLVNEFNKA